MIKIIITILILLTTPTIIPNESPSLGLCEECYSNVCVQAPCNLECKTHGTWCETIVMAGGAQAYVPETKASGGDYAQFFMQEVEKNNLAMEAAGIKVGDRITHVNNQWAESVRKFAELVIRLPKGTKLRVIRQDKSRAEITL